MRVTRAHTQCRGSVWRARPLTHAFHADQMAAAGLCSTHSKLRAYCLTYILRHFGAKGLPPFLLCLGSMCWVVNTCCTMPWFDLCTATDLGEGEESWEHSEQCAHPPPSYAHNSRVKRNSWPDKEWHTMRRAQKTLTASPLIRHCREKITFCADARAILRSRHGLSPHPRAPLRCASSARANSWMRGFREGGIRIKRAKTSRH